MRFMKKVILTLLLVFSYCHISLADITDSPKYSALVVDQSSKKILYQKDARMKRYPASLTKVMTLYIMFEALEKGKLHMNQSLHVSAHAAGQPPSKLNLKGGETIKVKDAIDALVVKSANDVAVAVAENLAGSEKNFAKRMTLRAKQLGLKSTNFTNASGLPDPNQYTNAIDMVKLAILVQKNFPQYFHNFNKNNFHFRGKAITGHNKVTENYPTATGLKTGYIRASGFNLLTTTSSHEGELVGVVFGADNSKQRNDHMIALLDGGYEKLRKLKTYQANNAISYNSTPYIAKAADSEYVSNPFNAMQQKALPKLSTPFKLAENIQ